MYQCAPRCTFDIEHAIFANHWLQSARNTLFYINAASWAAFNKLSSGVKAHACLGEPPACTPGKGKPLKVSGRGTQAHLRR